MSTVVSDPYFSHDNEISLNNGHLLLERSFLHCIASCCVCHENFHCQTRSRPRLWVCETHGCGRSGCNSNLSMRRPLAGHFWKHDPVRNFQYEPRLCVLHTHIRLFRCLVPHPCAVVFLSWSQGQMHRHCGAASAHDRTFPSYSLNSQNSRPGNYMTSRLNHLDQDKSQFFLNQEKPGNRVINRFNAPVPSLCLLRTNLEFMLWRPCSADVLRIRPACLLSVSVCTINYSTI